MCSSDREVEEERPASQKGGERVIIDGFMKKRRPPWGYTLGF